MFLSALNVTVVLKLWYVFQQWYARRKFIFSHLHLNSNISPVADAAVGSQEHDRLEWLLSNISSRGSAEFRVHFLADVMSPRFKQETDDTDF